METIFLPEKGEKMYQKQSYSVAPRYENTLSRRIGVLQQVQTLLHNDATLNDVAQLVQSLQQEFGMQEQLEHVIQFLVGRSLKEQLSQRQPKEQRAEEAHLSTAIDHVRKS